MSMCFPIPVLALILSAAPMILVMVLTRGVRHVPIFHLYVNACILLFVFPICGPTSSPAWTQNARDGTDLLVLVMESLSGIAQVQASPGESASLSPAGDEPNQETLAVVHSYPTASDTKPFLCHTGAGKPWRECPPVPRGRGA